MPMTPEFKEKWLAALRSGEYKKTTGTLYSKETDSFCCLGVACVIGGFHKEQIQSEESLNFAYTNNGVHQSEFNGFGLDEREVIDLYSFNDSIDYAGKDTDFARVADYIEAKF